MYVVPPCDRILGYASSRSSAVCVSIDILSSPCMGRFIFLQGRSAVQRCTRADCLRCSSRCAQMSLNTFVDTTLFYFVSAMSQRVVPANAAMSDKVQRESEISTRGGQKNILSVKEKRKRKTKATVTLFVFDGIPLGKAPLYFEPWLKPTRRRRHSPKTGPCNEPPLPSEVHSSYQHRTQWSRAVGQPHCPPPNTVQYTKNAPQTSQTFTRTLTVKDLDVLQKKTKHLWPSCFCAYSCKERPYLLSAVISRFEMFYGCRISVASLWEQIRPSKHRGGSSRKWCVSN